MTLNLALTSALSGLQVSQKGIDVTSHNIANVNSPGFTKKVFTQESRVLTGVGVGVQTGAVVRNVDRALLEDIQNENALLEQLETKDLILQRIQDLFGEPADNTSLSHQLTQLQAAFEELAVEASKSASQINVVREAAFTVDQLRNMTDLIQSQRLQADRAIETAVDEANSIIAQIDVLNNEIVRTGAVGAGTADLEDQRDNLLKDLAALVDIRTFTRETGEIIILTNNGRSLLDREITPITHLAVATSEAQLSYSAGDFNPIQAGTNDLTNEIQEGRIAALIELRDDTLPAIQAELDELTNGLMSAMNAVHNRGTSYPAGRDNMEGTRVFQDSANQTVTFSGGDVRIAVFDGEGVEAFTTSLGGDLGFTTGTIDTMATTIETWLTGTAGLTNATVAVNGDGKLEIELGTTSFSLSFRDEDSSTPGSPQQDITIDYDADADGTDDETYEGFSSFFGLNDLFISNQKNFLKDSAIFQRTTVPGITAPATLTFSDETNGLAFASVVIAQNDRLVDIVDRINSTTALDGIVSASLIEDGRGYRLRIRHEDGEELSVTEVAGTDLLDRLGLRDATASKSASIRVRADIEETPDLISRGAVQFDENSGEYFVSAGDNQTANQLASVFSNTQVFEEAGSLSAGNLVLSDYAAAILSNTSSDAQAIRAQLDYQRTLVTNLDQKRAEISDVNLDEELSQLLIFEQSYNAAARVISTTRDLFDILNSIVR